MIFYLACLLVALLVVALPIYLTTLARLRSDWQLDGPREISDRLRRRNRTVLVVFLCIALLIAFLEMVVTDYSFWIQDLQATPLLGGGAPLWAVPSVANGSFSWLLYLCLAVGVLGGLLVGTIAAIRKYTILSEVGVLKIV
jgi:amino acid transporter